MPPKATTELSFADQSQAESLISQVRSDNQDLAWVVFKYEANSDNVLSISGSGTGGLDEFRATFDESERMYGLLRTGDVYDGHSTVKFVFVAWAGTRVSVMRKARMTTHKGSIVSLIGQAHITIDASEPADLSDDVVMTRITDASGSGNRVLDASAIRSAPTPTAAPVVERPAPVVSQPAPVREESQEQVAPAVSKPAPVKQAAPKSHPSVPKTGNTASELSFANEEEGAHAISRVRNDDDAADWVLFGYEGDSNVIVLIDVGTGGVEELKPHLKPNSINYGLVRVYDSYDGHRTTKFVLVLWVGESVRVFRKARITTHKGAVVAFLGQFHVDIPCATLDEVNQDIIMKAVQDAAGTAIHVKD